MRAIGEGCVFDAARLVAIHAVGLGDAVGVCLIRRGKILECEAVEEWEETMSLVEVIVNCNTLVLLREETLVKYTDIDEIPCLHHVLN